MPTHKYIVNVDGAAAVRTGGARELILYDDGSGQWFHPSTLAHEVVFRVPLSSTGAGNGFGDILVQAFFGDSTTTARITVDELYMENQRVDFDTPVLPRRVSMGGVVLSLAYVILHYLFTQTHVFGGIQTPQDIEDMATQMFRLRQRREHAGTAEKFRACQAVAAMANHFAWINGITDVKLAATDAGHWLAQGAFAAYPAIAYAGLGEWTAQMFQRTAMDNERPFQPERASKVHAYPLFVIESLKAAERVFGGSIQRDVMYRIFMDGLISVDGHDTLYQSRGERALPEHERAFNAKLEVLTTEEILRARKYYFEAGF